MFTRVGKNSQKPQTCTELTLARKNAPLPAVLERAFPKQSNLETQQLKQAPAFLKKNKLVLWNKPSSAADDCVRICLTRQHHILQNHGFQKYTHKGTAYQISKHKEPKILLSSPYQGNQTGLNFPVPHVKQTQLLCLGWQQSRCTLEECCISVTTLIKVGMKKTNQTTRATQAVICVIIRILLSNCQMLQ